MNQIPLTLFINFDHDI